MNEDNVLRKWTETGFLEGLEENLKNLVAIEFEKMYRHILQQKNMDELTGTVVFPIIRKIMTTSNIKTINCAEILRLFDKELAELMTITIANENAQMDLLAEACSCVADEYIRLHEK